MPRCVSRLSYRLAGGGSQRIVAPRPAAPRPTPRAGIPLKSLGLGSKETEGRPHPRRLAGPPTTPLSLSTPPSGLPPTVRILGLSFDYHEAAAVLMIDGTVVAAALEERFSRIKHDAALPRQAAAFCLKQAGIHAAQLDHVVHYENPLRKFDRIVWSGVRSFPGGLPFLREAATSWLRGGKFRVRERIAEALGVELAKISCGEHHASHAASAFYPSPFDEATVLTLDGVGEYETASISLGRGHRLEKLGTLRLPHSLGLFYSAMTAYLGFHVNGGEYKVMGMAGFGQPTHYPELMKLFRLLPDGTFRLKQNYFDFLTPRALPYRPALVQRFGPARPAESPFAPEEEADETTRRASRHYADLAASVQRCVEEVILHMASKAVARTGVKNLCLAGGVALNSLANGRIQRELGLPLFVQPAAGDAGGAWGAAAHHHHHVLGHPRREPARSALAGAALGRAFSPEELRAALGASGFHRVESFPDDAALVEETARRLAQGAVIGWFQGRSEWGPRALGQRSILADPTRPDMQRIVNERIKFREPFRPFAPAVPAERAAEFFAMPPAVETWRPESFMLAVHRVRPEMRSRLPAVAHADGTARVQAVHREVNPLFHQLLTAFGDLRGVPVLLNTSFNLRDEPMVDSPADALQTFAYSDMDHLVLGRFLVSKGLDL
ncbi:MAG: hypothetical protein HQL51_09565 [Magnetococcales bacterium]|nr:hypothetical protein [Magnetococcales bacterium]